MCAPEVFFKYYKQWFKIYSQIDRNYAHIENNSQIIRNEHTLIMCEVSANASFGFWAPTKANDTMNAH